MLAHAHRLPLSLILGLLVSASAYAGEDDAIEVTHDLSHDMFVPPAGASVSDAPRAPRHAPHIIYLNYDGGQITSGGGYSNDSRTNQSWVCQANFTPFGDGQKKDATVQATKVDWELYNVQMVTERPASGNYHMDMIGGGGCGGAGSGVAPLDCDNQNANDIVFTFATSSSVQSVDGIATINSQELAHAFGLEHVSHQPEIMNPSWNGSNQSFIDQCYSITGSLSCGSQHARHCGAQNQQNSHQELMELVGPSMPDAAPPTVAITAPADGATFGAPATFEVSADASDDTGIMELRIFIDGADQNSPDGSAPYAWPVNNVPEGVYTFEVVAFDVAGNETTSAPVTVEVTGAGGSGGSAGSGDDASGSGSGSGTSSDSGGDSGDSGGWDPGDDGPDALPPGFGTAGDDGDPSSCACRSDAPLAPTAVLGLLALLGLRRRG